MEMGTQGSGRRRLPQRERLTAEDDALSQIAREAEARLAAKRAARAEAREIRMKELERQQKEIYQVQKKYYGLDAKWGDIEQWMEDSERFSHRFRRNPSASDEDERMSVGSRGSLRSQAELDYAGAYSAQTNGHDGDAYGGSPLSRKPSRGSRPSHESKLSTRLSSREEKLGSYYSDLGLSCSSLPSRPSSASQNGARPSFLFRDAQAARWRRASAYEESVYGGSRRFSASSSLPPSEYSGYLGSGSRASSRASSARASPVVEERPEKDFTEKGSRNMPSLSAATLASLGGTSSRRGSGDTSISVDTEASIREIKEINELKDQIQDVEGKYMQGLKEMKDSLAEVEEKYKKAMVSNAQLDNEKTNFMYQVDTLKDALLELEEQLAESRRQYEEKNKEFERQKHAHSVLQFQFAEAKEALKQREEMLAALERQKEYLDSVRSERDDLRAEAMLLKEELKKHGIILNSEVTTNGEPLDNRSNMSHLGSPKVSQEETNALKSSSDGTLGRVKEVKVASENVDKVGESAVLQNPEREQPRADSAEAGVDTKASPPDGSAEAETPPPDNATVPETLAKDSGQELLPTRVPETYSVPGNNKQQVGDRTRAEPSHFPDASVEPSHHDTDQNQDTAGSPQCPGDVIIQDGCSSLDAQNEKKELLEKQKEGKPEGESSGKLVQETDPLGTSSTERIGTVMEGANENHSESLFEGTEARVKKHLDTNAGREGSKEGAVSSNKKCTNLTKGDQKEEEETPGISKGEKEENESTKEELMQTIPSSPKLKSGQPEKTGTVPTGEVECSDPNVPAAGRDDQKGEVCETSSKKSKNKKRKNKKKKSPPVGSPEDVKKELVFQNTEEDEEEEVKNPAKDAFGEVAHNEKQEARADLDEYVDCPEGANADSDDKPNLEVDKVKKLKEAVGDDHAAELGRDTTHLWGADGKGEFSSSVVAKAESLEDDSISSDDPSKKATEQNQTYELENEGSSGSRPENNIEVLVPKDSSHAEMEESCSQSDEQTETAEEVVESSSLESDELEDPLGSGKEDAQGRTSKGKDKNKEECTLS
ncbi:leucine-rich repeat flightless-interacting protein 1 isoform X8 [Monodelphis domestica]|uniref:leucine-rich repeat flightless-interacting protein 1 isoform X8 n=1 Tax=Monodelphis domestica TaxID=13616 RepID=UPI0024E1E553|nr:leucine-rich repeat flightless-interacting protein 1 isoform X8 [Monodelphis domestica]